MQIKREDISQHFASLPDEELLALDRDDLSELARECYINELNRRQLEPASDLDAPLPEIDGSVEVEADWLDTATTACSFQVGGGQRYAEDAERACAILRDAGIPSDVISEQEDGAPDSLSVRVPGALSLKAASVLDRDLFNEELEETWKSHFDHLSDEELRALHPDDLCAGLLDRAARLKRAYEEAIARRKPNAG